MDVPDNLLCLFSARIEEQDGSFVIEIPDSEVEIGDISGNETYRIGVFSAASPAGPGPQVERPGEAHRATPEPPVEEGEIREVEIEDIGEKGDGIARIGPGYIVFVPETVIGDRVTVEITDVRENFAFGEVIQGRE